MDRLRLLFLKWMNYKKDECSLSIIVKYNVDAAVSDIMRFTGGVAGRRSKTERECEADVFCG